VITRLWCSSKSEVFLSVCDSMSGLGRDDYKGPSDNYHRLGFMASADANRVLSECSRLSWRRILLRGREKLLPYMKEDIQGLTTGGSTMKKDRGTRLWYRNVCARMVQEMQSG
jgi:hypothetical protein